jgi:cytochrome P450
MHAYFQQMIEARHRVPEPDLISLLLQTEYEGRSLTNAEIQGFCGLLLVAGSETTTHLLSNAFLSFAEYPDAFQALQADSSLLEGAIEEILRYRAPVRHQLRVAVRDLEWYGCRIKAGDLILPIIASANRDEHQFQQPDRFEIQRSPNPHLSFGRGGIHYCLGAPLARLEARIVLTLVLSTMLDIQLLPDIQLQATAPGLGGVLSLPITFRPKTQTA